MKKIIRLTESDLSRIIKKVMSEQNTVPRKSFLDGVNCNELIACIKKLSGIGGDGKKSDSIPVINLELCLSKKVGDSVNKKCTWQNKTCPETLNCMPSPNTQNPCRTAMGQYCISNGCTQALQ
jgi:hypothetical protein